MLGGRFIPRPIPKLPTLMPDPSLGVGFLNSPASKAAKKKFIEAVNKLSEGFSLSSAKKDFMSVLIGFFGDSVTSQFDPSEAMGDHERLNIFSDVKTQGFPVSLPGNLSGKNLQSILADKDYKGLSTADGVALIQAIKTAVEQIDSTSSEILKWQKDENSSELEQYGAFNCTLLGFLMDVVQGMPSEIKGIFTSGSDFHTWAMQTLDDYEKSCKQKNESPSFNVSALKNDWNSLSAKVDGWNNIDAKALRSFVSRPMIAATFKVRLDNQMKKTQNKKADKRYKMKKEKAKKEQEQLVKEAKNTRQEQLQMAKKAEKAKLQKMAWARKQAKAKKA